MTLEKAGKGPLSPPGSANTPRHTHGTAVKLLDQLHQGGSAANASIHQALRMTPNQRKAYLNSLRSTVGAIERLAPALAANGPNAEYPWLPPNTENVIVPADYPFDAPELSQAKLINLVKLLTTVFTCLEHVEKLN